MRLVAPGLHRQWNGDSIPSSASDSVAHFARIGAAAKWIADNLHALGAARLDALCVDPEGAVCTWFSATSPDEKVVSATLAQAALAAGDASGSPSGSAVVTGGGAAGRLAMLASSDPMTALSELTLQPLAVARPGDDPTPTGGLGKWAFGRGKSAARATTGTQGRFALLSIPDACVRVLVDSLDDLGVEIGSVTSLWHALGAAFDPSARSGAGADAENVVASSDPATAVIMVDPRGRMVWSWSRAGMLVAGGSMRLRLITPPSFEPSTVTDRGGTPAEPEPIDALSASGAGTARRLGGQTDQVSSRADEPAPEASSAEVGRLVADWLAWSTQLGAAPQRVVCFGPATSPQSGVDPAHPSFGQALAKAWPGATVDLFEHDDPVGLTLQRLAGVSGADMGSFGASARLAGHDRDVHIASDPRLSLTALSNRPGRSSRRMNRWVALAILLAATFVAVWGYQLHRSAGRADALIAKARSDRAEIVAGLEPLIPTLAREPNPDAVLTARINTLSEQARAVRQAPPLLGEVVRLLKAFRAVQSELPEDRRDALRIQEMTLSTLAAVFRLEVPDSETGPRIEIAVKASPGLVQWSGRAPGPTAGPQTYILTGILPQEPLSSTGGGGPR